MTNSRFITEPHICGLWRVIDTTVPTAADNPHGIGPSLIGPQRCVRVLNNRAAAESLAANLNREASNC